MRGLVLAAGFWALGVGAGADVLPGDAQRGAALLREQQCLSCHGLRGAGGTTAADLGRMTGRNYTPTWMASIMWNHAPTMWAAMRRKGVPAPQLTEAQAADLFAYFQSARFFERPGDAARGKQIFASKHCADCHDVSSARAGGGPPVATWKSIGAPIVLAQAMWNHATQMLKAMQARGIRWPTLTGQELTDVLVYVQNLPQTRGRIPEFALGAASGGDALFKQKGCATCHVGALSLEKRPASGTLTDVAAAMWNHAPKMRANQPGTEATRLEPDEMRQILAYLWYEQVYAEPGSPERGKHVFEDKKCSSCHNDASSGAPDLKKMLAARNAPLRAFSMASVLWQHGPAMLDQLTKTNRPWPRFGRSEMADLLAYLNSPAFAGPERVNPTK